MTRIETSISPNYAKTWTRVQAAREIIQNFLDVTDGHPEYKGWIWYNDEKGIAEIKDFGPGLEMRHLCMGVSEKSEDARGKYGSGLKQGLLALARQGDYVEILSNSKRITPKIENSETFGTDVMVFYVEPYRATRGTNVRFACTKAELEEAKSFFIEFLRGKIVWYDKHLSTPGGSLFINKTKVGTIPDALFSYHFEQREAGELGNEDRNMYSAVKLNPLVKTTISRTQSSLVKKMVLQHVFDSFEGKLGIEAWGMCRETRSGWARAAREVLGNGLIASSDTDKNTRADYLGYRVIPSSTLGSSWLGTLTYCGLKTVDNTVALDERAKTKPATVKLTAEDAASLASATALVKKYYADPGKVVVVKEIALDGMKGFDGCWESKTKTIYIIQDAFATFERMLLVLFHETVHKVSGATDCTEAFERAFATAWVKLVVGLSKKS